MRAAIEKAMHDVGTNNGGCVEITGEGKWHASTREFRRKRFVFAFLCKSQTLLWFIPGCSAPYIIIDAINDFTSF